MKDGVVRYYVLNVRRSSGAFVTLSVFHVKRSSVMSFIDSLALQPAHGYPLLVTLLIPFIHVWGHLCVNHARGKYGIERTTMYAEKSQKYWKEFNCIQRAHRNIAENIPLHFLVQGISSIHRPEYAALAGLVRILGFIAYFIDYASGGVPNERKMRLFGLLGHWVMVILSLEFAGRLLTNK